MASPSRPLAFPALRALAAAGAWAWLTAGGAVAAGAGSLEQARASGALSAQQAAAYQLLAIVDPDAVPAPYREPPQPTFCATPLAVAANEARAGADPLTGRLLDAALQRPSLDRALVTPSGHFRLHYNSTGREAADPADGDGNGVPDYVDLAGAIADSVWHLQVEVLGYEPPPADNGVGGGDEVDIYILDLGRFQNYGITFPISSGTSGASFMEIDNDFTNPIYGSTVICPGHRGVRGTDALRVTLAHEFFHVLQFGYYQGSDGSWFQEATATWMEDVAYPQVDDYLQYICAFLLVPGRALDSGLPTADFHAYGASVFIHFLDQRYRRDLIRWTWEEHSRRANASLDNLNRAILNVDKGGLESAFSEAAVWAWFTEDRYRRGFFAEGDKYPALFVPPFSVAAKAVVADSGRVDHMATKYMRFEPRLLTGGAVLDTRLARGRWKRRLLLVSPDTVQVLDISEEGKVKVPGWDAYDDVVLVLSNVDVIGIGYDYQVSVEYDPDLTDAPAPLAMTLGPSAPNPFRPGRDAAVLIPYELERVSQITRLSVFAADGRLVRRFENLSGARRRDTVRWDGANDDGNLVGSGVYYAVLEADGAARRVPLAVVRDR